jgi:hypothetical protein
MSNDLTPEEQDYSSRLYLHILNEVIGLDATEDGTAGAVRPHIVRAVLMDVAATIDFNAQLGRVPSERRETGEMLGKRYAAFLKSLIENDTGGWAPAVQVPTDGKPN